MAKWSSGRKMAKRKKIKVYSRVSGQWSMTARLLEHKKGKYSWQTKSGKRWLLGDTIRFRKIKPKRGRLIKSVKISKKTNARKMDSIIVIAIIIIIVTTPMPTNPRHKRSRDHRWPVWLTLLRESSRACKSSATILATRMCDLIKFCPGLYSEWVKFRQAICLKYGKGSLTGLNMYLSYVIDHSSYQSVAIVCRSSSPVWREKICSNIGTLCISSFRFYNLTMLTNFANFAFPCYRYAPFSTGQLFNNVNSMSPTLETWTK